MDPAVSRRIACSINCNNHFLLQATNSTWRAFDFTGSTDPLAAPRSILSEEPHTGLKKAGPGSQPVGRGEAVLPAVDQSPLQKGSFCAGVQLHEPTSNAIQLWNLPLRCSRNQKRRENMCSVQTSSLRTRSRTRSRASTHRSRKKTNIDTRKHSDKRSRRAGAALRHNGQGKMRVSDMSRTYQTYF